MKKYEITWFKDFSCLCGDCPQTCCRGWVIPLSSQDCERFRQERGMLGIRLFVATGGWTREKFNKDSGSCPFLRRDGLCRLQKEKGHDFIPWTCQSYPRFYRNYGTFEESCLDLSCIGAARLFIKNGGSLEVTESERDPETMPCATNDDEAFLEFLIKSRQKLTETAKKDISGNFADILFKYAIMCQDHYSKGEHGSEIPAEFGSFYDSRNDRMQTEYFGFPLPAAVLIGFLRSSLFHPRLRKVDPHLYRMFKKARALIGKYKARETAWRKAAEGFLGGNPFLKAVLGNYLAYYLYQYWMRTYETYSFRRQAALGLCHMNMVLLLAMSEDAGGESDGEEKTAEVIAAYNRRAYFNDDIQDGMYRIFEDHYKEFIRSGQHR